MYRDQAEKRTHTGQLQEAVASYHLEQEAYQKSGAPRWQVRDAQAQAEQLQRLATLKPEEQAKLNAALDAAEKVGTTATTDEALKTLDTLDRLFGRGSQVSLRLARRLARALAATGGSSSKIDDLLAQLVNRLETERGKDYPDLRACVEEWAHRLDDQGDALETADKPAEAAARYQRVVQLLSTYFGRRNYLTRSARCTWERARVLTGRGPEDRRAVRRSFALMTRCGKLTASPAHFKEALKLAQEALAIRVRVLGQPNREVGFCHYAIGKLMEKLNRYADAEAHYREALTQYRQVLGDTHPNDAEVWTNLGSLHMLAARPDAARAALTRALRAWGASLGPRHPTYARGLVNLASIPLRAHDTVEASDLLEEAIGILEQADEQYAGDLARACNGLAMVCEGTGRLDDAEMLLQKAIRAWKRAGLDVDRAITLDNLAMLLRRQDRLREAEPFSARAVALLEATLGRNHQDTIEAQANRAALLGQLGRPREALALLEQDLDASLALFEASALAASERDGLMALLRQRTLLDAYLTFALPAKAPPEAVYRRVVRWKAAVFGRQRTERFIRRQPALAGELASAQDAVARLARLCRTPAEAEGLDVWQKAVREAAAARDGAERALAGGIKRWKDAHAELPEPNGADGPPDLPHGAVVLDFFQYTRYAPGGDRGSLAMLAFILRPDHTMTLADLGDTHTLARTVDDWRRVHIDGRATKSRRQVDDALRRQIVTPLAGALGQAKLIVTCPDGPLTRMPLAVLPHPHTGRPLLETALVVTIPHLSELPGRAVLESWLPSTAAKAHEPMHPRPAPRLLTLGALAYGPPARRGFSFKPLAHVAGELAAVRASYGSFKAKPPTSLTGEQATRAAVLAAMPGKRFIHLATHGFVVPKVQMAQLMRADEQVARALARGMGGAPASWRAAALLGNGVLSGLALSDANRAVTASGADPLLSAADVALLDLTATRLVVLSACDTGLGDQAEAEGVLGLQRAFHVAGAQAVIASLWNVDDAATAQLMTSFYHHLWVDGAPAPVALRQAQLELRAGSVLAKGPDREPDFKATPRRSPPVRPAAGADSVRLWAAFTISYCQDSARDPGGRP